MIKVRYSSIDGFSKSRSFKTLAGAQKFAQHYLGPTPECGSWYAVAGDGVGKITCQGCTLAELFPAIGAAMAGYVTQAWADDVEP